MYQLYVCNHVNVWMEYDLVDKIQILNICMYDHIYFFTRFDDRVNQLDNFHLCVLHS